MTTLLSYTAPMETYLLIMRHGDTENHPMRPLSAKGKAQAISMAKQLNHWGIPIQTIYHSPILRATQTTQILSEHLNSSPTLQPEEFLAIDGNSVTWENHLMKAEGTSLYISHMPMIPQIMDRLFDRPEYFETAQCQIIKRQEDFSFELVQTLLPL